MFYLWGSVSNNALWFKASCTNFSGGLGVRLTCLMVKISLEVSAWQYSSGLSPGTERSSRTLWSPPKKLDDLEATSEERKNGTSVFMSFMAIIGTLSVCYKLKKTGDRCAVAINFGA